MIVRSLDTILTNRRTQFLEWSNHSQLLRTAVCMLSPGTQRRLDFQVFNPIFVLFHFTSQSQISVECKHCLAGEHGHGCSVDCLLVSGEMIPGWEQGALVTSHVILSSVADKKLTSRGSPFYLLIGLTSLSLMSSLWSIYLSTTYKRRDTDTVTEDVWDVDVKRATG